MAIREKVVIGCDPGNSGAFSVIRYPSGEHIESKKTPGTLHEYMDMMQGFVMRYDVVLLLKEQIHSRPTNGAKQNYSIGWTVGTLESMLMFFAITNITKTPSTWMKYYNLKKDPSESDNQWKNRLKAKALQLYPDVSVTLWNADAILIARYALDNLVQHQPS